MTHRFLVIRSCAFGDMVMMTAMFRALEASTPGARISMVSGGAWSPPVFERSPCAEQCYILGSMKTPWGLSREKRLLARRLRSEPWDAIWTWGDGPTSRFAARCARSGVPVHSIADVPRHADEHDIDHFLRFVGYPPAAFDPRLTVLESDVADADGWLERTHLADRPFLLIQPGNKKTMRRARRDRASNVKYWPEARWTEVMRGVLDRDPDLALVVCGIATERGLAEEIGAGLPPDRVVNAAGELPIPRLLGLCRRARAMISVDTGPAHAAAVVGCPVLVLFGSTDPRRVAPRGPGPIRLVHQASPEPLQPGKEWWARNHSMMGLEARSVLDAWEGLRRALPTGGPRS